MALITKFHGENSYFSLRFDFQDGWLLLEGHWQEIKRSALLNMINFTFPFTKQMDIIIILNSMCNGTQMIVFIQRHKTLCVIYTVALMSFASFNSLHHLWSWRNSSKYQNLSDAFTPQPQLQSAPKFLSTIIFREGAGYFFKYCLIKVITRGSRMEGFLFYHRQL